MLKRSRFAISRPHLVFGALAVLLLTCSIRDLPAGGGPADAAPRDTPELAFLTLLPPLVAIVLSFITKNVVLSLLLGVFSGTLLLSSARAGALAAPLAHLISPDSGFMILCVGAVLTGAIFGDHCSPISDTTILSAMGSACDLMDHTNTQLGYALAVAVISTFFGYLPVSLGVSVWLALPVALLATCATVYVAGRRVDDSILAGEPKSDSQ